MLIPFNGKEPQLGENVFIAPTAVLIGDVRLGRGAVVMFGAVLRGDMGTIQIGEGTNIQDNATIHTPKDGETIVGANVTIGHGAILEGCVVHDNALIGMNAVALAGADIGEQAMVAAGSVVREGSKIPARTLAAGVPAIHKKDLGGSSLEWTQIAATAYHTLRDQYKAAGVDKLKP